MRKFVALLGGKGAKEEGPPPPKPKDPLSDTEVLTLCSAFIGTLKRDAEAVDARQAATLLKEFPYGALGLENRRGTLWLDAESDASSTVASLQEFIEDWCASVKKSASYPALEKALDAALEQLQKNLKEKAGRGR